MKVRIFRGAIKPPVWAGMPFLFGIGWMIISFLSLLYVMVFFYETPKTLAAGLLIILFLSGTIFVLVRDITKKDPYRLRQVRLRLFLRLEQGNFGRRGEFVYTSVEPRKKK